MLSLKYMVHFSFEMKYFIVVLLPGIKLVLCSLVVNKLSTMMLAHFHLIFKVIFPLEGTASQYFSSSSSFIHSCHLSLLLVLLGRLVDRIVLNSAQVKE